MRRGRSQGIRHGWFYGASFSAAALGVGVALLLLLPTGLSGITSSPSSSGEFASALRTGSSASVTVAAFSKAVAIPSTFWGVNVAALQAFGSTDAAAVAQTPVTYLRFPGGILGEELNYTSNVLTSQTGTHPKAAVSVATFVSSCNSIHCNAILQLPAEIDQPSTAAYYAKYVVHTLGFQPAYWEIGNAPSGWKHFKVPWNQWATKTGVTNTPNAFAAEVKSYIAAIKAVDPSAKFIALGAGMGDKDYAKTWVTALVQADGKNLSGVSVHSYIMGGGPSSPTDQELFANLHGQYSLPAQMAADQKFIQQACTSCKGIQLFITEINAAEISTYDRLLPSFAGTLYLAAETTQGLTLRAPNLDWFCYDCSFPGAWSQSRNHWQMQYYLFSDLLSKLQPKYLPANVTGPSTFYAAATYGTSGLALLLVNVNTTTTVSVALGHAGITLGSHLQMYAWNGSTSQPSSSALTLGSSLALKPLSIVLLLATTSQLV